MTELNYAVFLQYAYERSCEQVLRPATNCNRGVLAKAHAHNAQRGNVCIVLCMAQVEPQNEQLPLGYSAVLSAFEKVLVLRMLRPDKVRWPAGGGDMHASY